MSRSGALIKNTFIFAIGNIGSKMLQFVLLPLYTRVMSDAEYGTVDILQSISTILIPIISLTIYEGVFRYAMDSSTSKEAAFSTGINISFLGALAAVICGIIMSATDFYDEYVWVIISYTVSNIFYSVALQYIRAINKVKLYAAANILQTFMIVIFNVILLVHLKWGVQGYMLGYTLSNITVFIVVFLAARLWKSYRVHDIGRRTVTDMLKYSIPLIPNAICWWITTTVGRLMVTAYLGSEANGIFAVAFKIPSIITIVVGIFFQAWQMSTNTEFGKADFAEYNSKAFHYLQTISFLLAAFLALFSKVIISFMGADFRDAWIYIPVMLIGIAFFTFSQFLGALYTASKKTFMAFVSNFIAAALNVIFNFILLPVYGVMGVAVSVMLSYFIFWLFRVFNTRSIVKLRYRLPLLIFNTITVGLICIVVTFNIKGWIIIGACLFVALLAANAKNLIELADLMIKQVKPLFRRDKK